MISEGISDRSLESWIPRENLEGTNTFEGILKGITEDGSGGASRSSKKSLRNVWKKSMVKSSKEAQEKRNP